MLNIRKILFPTDFSECSKQAFSHAVFLAEKHDAEIHILHVITLHENDSYKAEYDYPSLEEYNLHLEKYADDRSDQLIKTFNAKEYRIIKVQKRDYSPPNAILKYAEKNHIDLIVMGTQGRRGLGYLFLGSTAEEIIRFARRPVLTVREQKTPKLIKKINNILLPLDLSQRSGLMLAYAKELCNDYDAKLSILHVIEDRIQSDIYATGKSSVYNIMSEITEKCTTMIKKMLEDIGGLGVEVNIKITEGYAAREILKFVEKNDVDLVMISSHGRSKLEHFMLGSVSEKVARRSSVPVFILRTFGRHLLK